MKTWRQLAAMAKRQEIRLEHYARLHPSDIEAIAEAVARGEP